MTQYAIAVDKKRCIGCWSCSVACKLENNLPDQVWWNTIITDGGGAMNTPVGTYGNCSLTYTPFHCMHCSRPACMGACPTGATAKDSKTGIVTIDTEKCIGCQSCIEACPYNGVRTFVEQDPVPALDWPVGSVDAPEHKKTTVEKCWMCYHRVSKGDVPACVEGCPARARIFGDVDDPNSEISQLIAKRGDTVLLEEAGTGPNVYYLS
ncbi:4Fe-4S ferredoxin [Denitrobacterium detoxificans]|uniref:Prokaryotic molybdopterin-containing oxidoreductase family, iron-sulfur binding subunit n=1 Tax=Denitrobacterium detoxificans TaxID=79604 RepID=A0A172RWM0_9ACTN|nr:4Fe-4S dicluster domain-containing protein [Denitrobacterium detoxificans]ANE22013.1 4Fe-4S ferredoxin [Denitrobacterium detoxificans]SEO96611.1 prokaryotic molybdopterin-containing oxidoreductase family, iron-sulfur binding subunit [Denitrobacterium detoxificans]